MQGGGGWPGHPAPLKSSHRLRPPDTKVPATWQPLCLFTETPTKSRLVFCGQQKRICWRLAVFGLS